MIRKYTYSVQKGTGVAQTREAGINLMKGGEKMAEKKLVKNVRFDFINNMGIGAVHIEAECEDVSDFKEALEFAKEAAKLMPPLETKDNKL